MKTINLSRWLKIFTIYYLLFFWATSIYAQCPIITDPNPTICDAMGYTFRDLSTDYVTDGGNGIVWYSVASGGIAISHAQLLQEGTYYVDNSSGSCIGRQPINVAFQVDPVPSGASIDKFYCSNENATIQDYINDALALHIPSGGNVNVYYDSALTKQANAADILAMGIVNYFIVFDNGTGGCSSQIKFGKSIISESPEDPTPINSQVFCADSVPTIADLDPGTLTASFNWYNNANAIPPALTSSTPLVNGQTYYVRVEDFLCVSNPVPVTVTINSSYSPGISDILEFCEDNISATNLNLFNRLGGSQDTNGTWTGPLTMSGGHLGNVDISTLSVGKHTFTYTVPNNGNCPSLSADVVIIIHETLSSGTVSTTLNPATFCESDAPASFDLFSLIDNEDIGGQWTMGTLNSDPVIVNPSDINLTILAPGTYNYTYTQNLTTPCAEESTTVRVVILPDPYAGAAIGPSPLFCENNLATNSPFNLFTALDGSQDNNGGVWTDVNNVTISNILDLTTLTSVGSPYSFNYTIDNGTCSNTTTITIFIEPAPESGVANAPVEFCLADIAFGQTYNLFDLLTGEDQSGTWSDDDLSGALTGNFVTLDGLMGGTYNFTYNVASIGTCDDVDLTVSIIINDIIAPTAVAIQEFCDTATVADLVAIGTTIQWYDSATGGTPLAFNTALIDGENYFASQTEVSNGCESSMRTQVIANIYQSPNSGNPAAPLVVCSTDTIINLNSGLDGTQDIGGIWQDTDGTGALTGSIFDASLVIPGSYRFTYSVSASAPCVYESTVITVTVEAPLNAGNDVVLDACSNDGSFDLITHLGGAADSGGIWSPALASGTGIFDPLIDASGTYTYSLTNACGTVSSEVVVNIILAPNAGANNTAAICVIDGETDLFTFLGNEAQIGGIWSPPLVSGTGVFDPLLDTAGVYTYTVTATSPCSPDSSAQITVTIFDSPAPIVLNSNPEFCLADNPTVSDLNATIRASGSVTWYADATSITPLDASEILVNGEDYFARQTTGSGCESFQTIQIIPIVNDVNTPTLINSNLELCINDDPTIMELTENILEYDPNLNNINWYDSATSTTPLSSNSLLIYDITYYATLYDATTGCESSVRLVYTPDLTSCGELVLPDGFSPNGDGINDTFDYNNLDILHPNFDIQIFNRYGSVVFKGTANSPRFDGTSNQASLGNNPLPVGVYFYIFNFKDGINKPKSGRLYLAR